MKLLKLFIALILCGSSQVFGQIVFSNNQLSVNGADFKPFSDFSILNWKGLSWRYDAKKFLYVDLTAENPRVSGSGNRLVLYNTESSVFNDIFVGKSYHQTKRVVQRLPQAPGLSTLLQLSTISYSETSPEVKLPLPAAVTLSEISQDSVLRLPETTPEYLFDVEKLHELLPSTTYIDPKGEYMVNYNSLIPILVQSIKDLQQIVAEQSLSITMLKAELSSQKISSANANLYEIVSCSPNPASSIVTITLSSNIPTSNVFIMITDMFGNIAKKINVGENTTIVEDISSLQKGIYIVTLMAEGVIADTNRLIIE